VQPVIVDLAVLFFPPMRHLVLIFISFNHLLERESTLAVKQIGILVFLIKKKLQKPTFLKPYQIFLEIKTHCYASH
jgi:hypothetical protein